jgi:hypothetical protein
MKVDKATKRSEIFFIFCDASRVLISLVLQSIA